MTDSTIKPARQRRMARQPQAAPNAAAPAAVSAAAPTTKAPPRLDQLQHLLLREEGASIAEMMAATGWQQHSVRGAMAGALKKTRGLIITSRKEDGLRRYRAEKPA